MRPPIIRHVVRCAACVFVMLVLSAGQAEAQQPVRQLEVGFERDVNAYRWIAALRVMQPMGAWTFELDDRFSSDALLLLGDELTFRDENVLRWRSHRPFGQRFTGGARGQTSWYSQSRVFHQEIYATLRYRPVETVWVEPAVGAAWDQRPSAPTGDESVPPLRTDGGPAYGFAFSAEPEALAGYDVTAHGLGTWQVINPRRGRTMRLDATARRSFEDVRVSLDVSAASLRRDSYQARSFLNRRLDRRTETIEATTSDTLRGALQVALPLLDHLRVTARVEAELQHREVRTHQAPSDALFYDTDFDRRAVDADVALEYEAPRLESMLTLQRGARIEDRRLANRDELPPGQTSEPLRSLMQADYDRGYLTLSNRTLARVSPNLHLRFQGSASILRHDTPDINPDDRDEAYLNGRVGLEWTASRYLATGLDVYASSYHTVYLRAERSAENNRRRSLRLEPSLTWTPSERTEIRLRSALNATYTVYDFVLPGRTARDQSARELRYAGGVEHDFGSGLRILFDGSYSDLRLGRLMWERFAEIPFDTLRTYSGHLRVQARPFGRLTAETGARFFVRSDYERTLTVRYETDAGIRPSVTRPGRRWIIQVGPTCALQWPLSDGAILRLDGWVNVQHLVSQLYGQLPDGAPRTTSGARTILPNLSMNVTWDF